MQTPANNNNGYKSKVINDTIQVIKVILYVIFIIKESKTHKKQNQIILKQLKP